MASSERMGGRAHSHPTTQGFGGSASRPFRLPVLEPEDLLVRIHVKPIPLPGHEPGALELELGVNGAAGVRRTVPPEGKLLALPADRSSLYRGDNAFYLYRISPQSDTGSWMSVGRIEIKKTEQGKEKGDVGIVER